MDRNKPRILLGQLAANGDCLYATTLARQIKKDFPGCHLTWAIASNYRSIISENPDIDQVWEIDYYTSPGNFDQWARFEAEARQRKAAGDFDEIFLTQICLDNFHWWTGSVRQALFRAYPRPITVEAAPVLFLSDQETENVKKFASKHCLAEKKAVILFECAPRSLQSFVDPTFALDVASKVVHQSADVALILSSNHTFSSNHPNIIDGSALTLRETAELTKYCSLLIGASSGVTWISTSAWAKPLPMLQLVRPDLARSNSLIYDFEMRGVDTSRAIEMSSYSVEDVVLVVDCILNQDFATARRRFHQQTPLKFDHYKQIQFFLLSHNRWKQSVQFIWLNIIEHGVHLQFFGLFVLLAIKIGLKISDLRVAKIKKFFERSS